MSGKEITVHAFVVQFGPGARHKGRTYVRKVLLLAEADRASGHTPDYQVCVYRTASIYKVAPGAIVSAIDRWIRHSWTQDFVREKWHQFTGLDPAGAPPTPMRAICLLCEAYLSGSSST